MSEKDLCEVYITIVKNRVRPGKLILNIISWGLFGLVVFITVGVIASIFSGAKLYTVTTGSMYPTYPIGTILYVEPVEFEDLSEGDVVTFTLSSDTVVTHRITDINKQGRLLKTQGDNNKTEDASPVAYSSVVGRVKFGIPFIGYAVMLARTRFGMIMAGIIVVCAILFSVIIRLLNSDESCEVDDEDDDSSGVQTE